MRVEVFPCGVFGLDQSNFLLSSEVFELRLAGDRVADVLEVFQINEAMDGVFCSVRSGNRGAMRVNTMGEIVGHADVEVSGSTGEDVDPEVIFAAGHGAW